jgi:hypothetical protein
MNGRIIDELFSMADLPISFEYQQKQYNGLLHAVSGAGGNNYYLMVNKYYCGNLLLLSNGKWAFHNQKGKLGDMAEYFGSLVSAWNK